MRLISGLAGAGPEGRALTQKDQHKITKLLAWQKEILKKGDLYRVGGSVRDRLMGIRKSRGEVDYLVRGIPPDELERMLEARGRIELVGKSFGVYKFKPRSSKKVIDIAFPRREVSTGPGHRDFRVNWDWSLPVEADLGRRDFTMNAIAQDVRDDRLIDPFDGRRDIEAGVLRMIFDEAFREDALRILRGIRFATCFSLDIVAKTRTAMRESVPLIKTISAERILDELNKTLTKCERPSQGFMMMHDMGVLKEILPELERGCGVKQNEFHPDDVFVHSIKTCDEAPSTNLAVRWAALLHDLGKVDKKQTVRDEAGSERIVFYGHEQEGELIAKRVLGRLRCSLGFIQKVTALVRHHMFNYQSEWRRATVRRFIRTIREENLEDLFLLREADSRSRDLVDEVERLSELRRRIDEELAEARALHVHDLAINGNDLQKLFKIRPGPAIGAILNDLLEKVLDTPELNTREKLLELVARDHSKK